MKVLEVTVSELTNGANSMKAANNEFREAFENMKQAADALADTWQGPAHDVFIQQEEQKNRWYRQIADIVEEYAQSMLAAAQEYEQVDKQGAATIRKH